MPYILAVINEKGKKKKGVAQLCNAFFLLMWGIFASRAAHAEGGETETAVCTDCHGVHDINSPMTALVCLRSPQLCADCHADEELMLEYAISTDVFEMYVADFHGETAVLFESDDPTVDTNRAVCYDCHGIYGIAANVPNGRFIPKYRRPARWDC